MFLGTTRSCPNCTATWIAATRRGRTLRRSKGTSRRRSTGDTLPEKKSFFETLILSMEMSYGTTGSLFRSGSRQTFFATQVTRLALYLSFVLRIELFPIKVCRYLRCLSAQHALLSHLLHV